jgi:hypothetical protein
MLICVVAALAVERSHARLLFKPEEKFVYSGAEIQVAKAINMVRERIANREGIADLSDRRTNWPRKIDPTANGFLVRVRGLGVILASNPVPFATGFPATFRLSPLSEKSMQPATVRAAAGCANVRD